VKDFQKVFQKRKKKKENCKSQNNLFFFFFFFLFYKKKELESKEKSELKKRVKKLGEKGLTDLDKTLKQALEDNKVHLPQELLDQLPHLPDISKIPELYETISYDKSGPFPAQIITTTTKFKHLKLCFEISEVPNDLRPYLVLFQVS